VCFVSLYFRRGSLRDRSSSRAIRDRLFVPAGSRLFSSSSSSSSSSSPRLAPFPLLHLPAVTSGYCVLLVADRYASLSLSSSRACKREREREREREKESHYCLSKCEYAKATPSLAEARCRNERRFFRTARRFYPSLFARARGECVKGHVPTLRDRIGRFACE
jgi:hypothetical protein